MTADIFRDMSYGQSPHTGYDMNQGGAMSRVTADHTLIIYRPFANQFRDVGIRPSEFKFSDEFAAHLSEGAERVITSKASASEVTRELRTSYNAATMFTPSIRPEFGLAFSKLDHNARFFLIMKSKTGLTSSFLNAGMHEGSSTIFIYSGYFLNDDPINWLTGTPNPNAQLCITHRSVVGRAPQFQGGVSKVVQTTMSTESFAQDATVAGLLHQVDRSSESPGTLTIQQTDNLFRAIETDGSGSSMIYPTDDAMVTPSHHATHNSSRAGSSLINDAYSNPNVAVESAAKAILGDRENQVFERASNRFASASPMYNGGPDYARMAAEASIHVPTVGGNPMYLHEGSIHTIGSIDAICSGTLAITPITIDRPMFHETADTYVSDLNNKFSWMLASTLPQIIESIGLTELEFEAAILRRGPMVDKDFVVHKATPLYTVHTHDLDRMKQAAGVEIMNGIMKMIFDDMGDIHVLAVVDSTGFTSIRLSLLGHGQRCMVPFEIPSCMGGNVSSLLGTMGSFSRNASALMNLHGIAGGELDPFGGATPSIGMPLLPQY